MNRTIRLLLKTCMQPSAICYLQNHPPSNRKGKYVLFSATSRAHWFSYHRLLDIKHVVIVTYFFRGNLLSPHRLHFPKGRVAHTTAFGGQVVDHWLELKIAQSANASTMQEDPNLYSWMLPTNSVCHLLATGRDGQGDRNGSADNFIHMTDNSIWIHKWIIPVVTESLNLAWALSYPWQ